MRKIIFVVLLVALFTGIPWSSSAQKSGEGLSKLMVEKLNNSKIMFEGIALSDFNKISRSAEKLIQISKTAEWFVYKTARYELHSNEFRRAAEAIMQKAQAKNLDGVALGYFDMTMACIRCHQYVREVRDARLSLPFSVAEAR
jgi:hypothetical protein